MQKVTGAWLAPCSQSQKMQVKLRLRKRLFSSKMHAGFFIIELKIQIRTKLLHVGASGRPDSLPLILNELFPALQALT